VARGARFRTVLISASLGVLACSAAHSAFAGPGRISGHETAPLEATDQEKVPAVSFVRNDSRLWTYGERGPTISHEIEALESLLGATDLRSERRPNILRRLAEDNVGLAVHLEVLQHGSGAARTSFGVDAVRRAQNAAIDYYRLLVSEYSGTPSKTFPANPPAAYAQLEEVYYCLAVEYEYAGNAAAACSTYLRAEPFEAIELDIASLWAT
jgi:hypothetical protein